jgi:hypothetical protein
MAKIDRAARKKARIERRANDWTKINLDFGPQDEKYFIDITKKLNKGGSISDLTEMELATFMKLAMNPPSKERMNKLLSSKDAGVEGIKYDQVETWVEKAKQELSSPENKNRLLELSRKQDIANKNTAYSNAIGLMLSAADVATGQSQIAEFRRRTKELKRPTRPGVMATDPYLDAAKKAAERGTYGESIAAKAARQQSFDAYQQDIQNARVASTGQAGGYGALAQAATTRLGRRGAEMAPQIEAFRQGREQQRAQMAGLSAEENVARYKSMAEMYPSDLKAYGEEATAVGELGQMGYLNRRTGLSEVAGYVPIMYGNERINRKYQSLRDALTTRGISPESADDYVAGVAQNDQRRNQQTATQQVAPLTGYNVPSVAGRMESPSEIYTGRVGYDIPNLPERFPVPAGMFPPQLTQQQQLAVAPFGYKPEDYTRRSRQELAKKYGYPYKSF